MRAKTCIDGSNPSVSAKHNAPVMGAFCFFKRNSARYSTPTLGGEGEAMRRCPQGKGTYARRRRVHLRGKFNRSGRIVSFGALSKQRLPALFFVAVRASPLLPFPSGAIDGAVATFSVTTVKTGILDFSECRLRAEVPGAVTITFLEVINGPEPTRAATTRTAKTRAAATGAATTTAAATYGIRIDCRVLQSSS